MKVYLASSWRNENQPHAVRYIQALGHTVYDFRNPPSNAGFGWEQIAADPANWSVDKFLGVLQDPIAEAGFRSDFGAMQACDALVMLLPCGRSAHLELGWAVGAGKKTCIVMPTMGEPELMIKMVDRIVRSLVELAQWFSEISNEVG